MPQNPSINRNRSLNDPRERTRILEQYAGIFPHAIKEFGEMVSKRPNKPRKNFSK